VISPRESFVERMKGLMEQDGIKLLLISRIPEGGRGIMFNIIF